MFYTPAEDVFHTIVVPCLMIFCFLSNSAFIYTVYCTPNLQTITNFYLVNMAVADLIFTEVNSILVYIYPYIKSPVQRDVYYGQSGCIANAIIGRTCFFTSYMLITTVTTERFIAICYPLYQRMMSGKSRTVKVIIMSWLLGFILATLFVPMSSYSRNYCIVWPNGDQYSALPSKISACESFPGYPVQFNAFLSLNLYFVSVISNFTMYARIIITLTRRAGNFKIGTSQHNAQRERNHVARLLITNGIVFFLCFTPYMLMTVHNTAAYYTGAGFLSKKQYALVQNLSLFLNYVNSSINPFIYIVCSSTYRNAYLKAFGLKCGSHKAT